MLLGTGNVVTQNLCRTNLKFVVPLTSILNSAFLVQFIAHSTLIQPNDFPHAGKFTLFKNEITSENFVVGLPVYFFMQTFS